MNSFFTSSDTFNIVSTLKRCVFFNAYNGTMKALITNFFRVILGLYCFSDFKKIVVLF